MAIVSLLCVVSCVYRGAVDESGYKPPAIASSGDPAPLATSTVAFVDAANLEAFTVGNPIGPFPFMMKIGPALREAIVGDLGREFQGVSIIPSVSRGDPYDFYAVLQNASWRRLPTGKPTPEIYMLSLRLIIAARQQRSVIGEYHPAVLVALNHTGGETVASALTLMTMGVLAPVMEPIKNDAWGQEVQTKLKSGIDGLANQLNVAIQNDQRLQTFAALGPIDLGMNASGLPAPDNAAASPYAKFLDSVVIVQHDGTVGSGFFVSGDGMIITCRHVVGNNRTVEVRRRDGTSFDADVIATSPERDLALIKIPGSGYPALPLLEDDEPAIGDEVIAIGTPIGIPWSVSKGIVSGLRNARSARIIQTDAAISAGSSGGPLIDIHSGKVVGINFMIMSGPQVEKLNFAISAAEVEVAFGDQLPPPP